MSQFAYLSSVYRILNIGVARIFTEVASRCGFIITFKVLNGVRPGNGPPRQRVLSSSSESGIFWSIWCISVMHSASNSSLKTAK